MHRISFAPSDLHGARHRPLPNGIFSCCFVIISLHIEYKLLIGGKKILFTSAATEASRVTCIKHVDEGRLNGIKTHNFN